MGDQLVAAALVILVLAVVGLAPDHVCARWWAALNRREP
jgi:hypothetical protein